jgi:hypothetical protein
LPFVWYTPRGMSTCVAPWREVASQPGRHGLGDGAHRFYVIVGLLDSLHFNPRADEHGKPLFGPRC